MNNAYLLAKIGAVTAENEQHFAEILPIGRRVANHADGPRPPHPCQRFESFIQNAHPAGSRSVLAIWTGYPDKLQSL